MNDKEKLIKLLEDFIKELKSYNNEINEFKLVDFPFNNSNYKQNKNSSCLHDNCSLCNGTGQRNDGLGMCIHMISCPCKKCTITC